MPRPAIQAGFSPLAPADAGYEFIVQTMEQAADAVVVIDDESRIVLFNGAAETLWGRTRGEVLGANVDLLVPMALRDVHDGFVSRSRNAGADHIVGRSRDVDIERSDGSRSIGSMSISRVAFDGRVFHTAFIRDVSAQRREQERMQQLSLVVDNSDNAIFVSDARRKVGYVNSGFTRLFGYTLEDLRDRKPSELLSGPRTDPDLGKSIDAALATGSGLQTEVLLYARSGRPLWISAVVNPVRDADGRLTALVSVLTDITQTKMHQVLHHKVLDAMVRELPMIDVMTLICREVEHIAPELVASIMTVDGDGQLHPLAAPSLPKHMIAGIDGVAIGPRAGSCGTAAWRGRPVMVRDIGSDPLMADYRHLLLPLGLAACWSNPIKSSNGRVLGTISFYYRESREPDALHLRLVDTCLHLCALALEREQTNERVHQLAFYDTLTGLPNRIMFSARAEQALANAAQTQATAALLFIDLDRFKLVNDTQGHAAGDGLLRDIAARLREEMPGANIIGRQAGDEFVALLPQCSAEQAGSIAERLIGAIAAPVPVGLMTLHPNASIGVSMFPDDGRNVDILVRNADMAMYRAKKDGGACFRFFSADMNRIVQERVSLETALREAIRLGQLQLHYQPQVSGNGTRDLHGVEALLRWQHPELGIIAPAQFIPMAEECGLIDELTGWVLGQACAQLAHWRRDGLSVPRVSLNMSAINFRDTDLSAQVARTLREHGLAPDDLIIEITESTMLDPDPDVLGNLEAIYAMGVRLSLDDFGTGYSSLSHLHRLPIYELKLDQSFVSDIDSSAIARTLITSVLRIGESLGMAVVAEGVETGSQQRFLAEQGCPILQGFLFSAPMPADELGRWLQGNDLAAAGSN
ncbi:diguanylate cyclase/phosphodiesterase with PAS/PAC sensor(s) [Luteimonas cucumeris]|uniref:Diguanylate cyclase/phosphodiesterase with PAS/PAC sensor(S) n=1 Tax=Luteimonas cucumeris TaxID=985012 RepID=A0A562KUC2_9GAMM|nr:EAL domain-containing protein [Luteimonas cucumeris]TWH98885.1 diguanylate cyclase/phosphodiesterase with PAS/PAC sensor(s) [Luteimonas cucumeris]